MSINPNKTFCDRSDCRERIENKQEEALFVQRPEDISSISAQAYCSSRCAKIAMKRYDEDASPEVTE